MKENAKKPEVQKSPRRKTMTPKNQKRVVEKETGEKNRREGAAGIDDSTRNLRKNASRSNNDRGKRKEDSYSSESESESEHYRRQASRTKPQNNRAKSEQRRGRSRSSSGATQRSHDSYQWNDRPSRVKRGDDKKRGKKNRI